MKGCAEAYAEVMQRACEITRWGRRNRAAYGAAEVPEVETHRVPVELDNTKVDARVDSYVEATTDDSREPGIVEVCDVVVEFRQIEGVSREPEQRVCEGLDSRRPRIVLELDAADEVVKPRGGVVNLIPDGLLVIRVVELQPDVAIEVSRRRGVEAVKALSLVEDVIEVVEIWVVVADVFDRSYIHAVMRVADVELILVVVIALRESRGRTQDEKQY